MKIFRHLMLLTIFAYGHQIWAQGPREKVKTLKIAYITEQLQLTTEEAQKFWPIYNEHENALLSIRKKEREQLGGQMASGGTLSESEAASLLGTFQELQEDKHQMESEFINRLRKVLPTKKIVLLIWAEESFKRRLLQQYRTNRGN